MNNTPTRLTKLLSNPFVGLAPADAPVDRRGAPPLRGRRAVALALSMLVGVVGLAVGMRPELLDLARMTVTRPNRPA